MIEPIVNNTTLIANIKISSEEGMAQCKVTVPFPENEGYWLQVRRVSMTEEKRLILCNSQEGTGEFTMPPKTSVTVRVYKKILGVDMPMGIIQLLFVEKMKIISDWKMSGVIQQ